MIRAIGLKQGTVWGAGLVAYGLIYRIADVSPYSPLKWLFYLMLAVGCVWSQRLYARRVDVAANAAASFGGKLATGALVGLVGAAIYSLYVFLFNLVDDSLIRTVVADSRRSIEASGADPSQVAKSLAFLEWMSSPGNFALLIFLQLVVVGAVAALVGAIFVRRRRAAEQADARRPQAAV